MLCWGGWEFFVGCLLVVSLKYDQLLFNQNNIRALFMLPLFRMFLTDSVPCPKPQCDYRSNLKYPSSNAREKITFSVDCSHHGIMREK